jgi:hypothetical protein
LIEHLGMAWGAIVAAAQSAPEIVLLLCALGLFVLGLWVFGSVPS